jgi:hypothetical protein
MFQKVRKILSKIIPSKHAHLCFGLFALYGISLLITQTSHFEKIVDGLKGYCYSDYKVRNSLLSEERMEGEFYREKYEERLSSLADGFFDYRDKKGVQAFFMSKGLLYDEWQEKNQNSYLLAQVIEKGRRKAEVPEEVIFDYLILGKKKIIPFSEYDEGREGRVFVSAGERVAYIHRDSIDYHLRWYFDSLWESDTRTPRGFYTEWKGRKDPLTYFLYRDLQEICEYIFQKRPYGNKKEAKQYFVEEGMKIYLPTMLTMGARMAADQDSNFQSAHRYLRACLTGLSLNPNHTMFYILKTSSLNSYNPLVRKGWEELRQRVDVTFPDEITLDKISKVSQEIFEKVKNSSTH